MPRRVGILGGTFDPIHSGHLDLASAAERALGLTEIVVVPAHIPPHRSAPMASAFHRFAMTAIAVAGRDGWRTSDLELQKAGRSFTAHTLRHMSENGVPPSELFFLIGADAFAEIGTWYDYPAILDLAHFAVVSRPGFAVSELRRRMPELSARMVDAPRIEQAPAIILIDAPTADVSSSAIRRRLANGESIAGLVPAGVQQHIEQHRLYTSESPDPAGPRPSPEPAAGRLHGHK